MEGSGGYFKSLANGLHRLPRLPPLFPGESRTGTATLEAKLLQQLASLREEVLYVIFLDLHKAYDALERSRCLEVLDGYDVPPQSC